ncbi:IclR family transcriptional regulator [Hydrogenophaga sp. BPS33]|uniref:IclR family transcriptional regulator n=1 Tax=Hydrogenophaga sp. BPS33 TaxID=2651974 RepID=UPI00131FFAFA|nr:helix-turn-helix domain-containing protein [Hydrogenophaga sp. BPS33]QHE88380.1 helix-turn-helix domain-containing protein [Hydrogenophaga sp. BPS33]
MPRKAQTPSLADANAATGGTAAVDRALSLLAAFRADDAALSLADLAARTQLHKSTALRLIASLEHARLLQRLDDGRYALGGEVARLHGIYAATFSLDRVVMPVLRQLVAATGESAAYHVRQGQVPNQTRLCLYRVDSPHPVRDHLRAGDVLPLHKGTGGRVLSAFGAGDDSRKPTLADKRTHARIREEGFMTSVGDRLAEVAGVSAPVFHADGTIAAALTLTMPAHRYDERHVGKVLAAARQLSGRVG